MPGSTDTGPARSVSTFVTPALVSVTTSSSHAPVPWRVRRDCSLTTTPTMLALAGSAHGGEEAGEAGPVDVGVGGGDGVVAERPDLGVGPQVGGSLGAELDLAVDGDALVGLVGRGPAVDEGDGGGGHPPSVVPECCVGRC